jgi:hypothetical protein
MQSRPLLQLLTALAVALISEPLCPVPLPASGPPYSDDAASTCGAATLAPGESCEPRCAEGFGAVGALRLLCQALHCAALSLSDGEIAGMSGERALTASALLLRPLQSSCLACAYYRHRHGARRRHSDPALQRRGRARAGWLRLRALCLPDARLLGTALARAAAAARCVPELLVRLCRHQPAAARRQWRRVPRHRHLHDRLPRWLQ